MRLNAICLSLMSTPINYATDLAKWLDNQATPTERWYKIDDRRYISTAGRVVSALDGYNLHGEPVRRLTVRIDKSNGLKYINQRDGVVYTRIYLDEAIANGELVPVSDDRRSQWGSKSPDLNTKLCKEAKKLALWLLDDERHPDFSHYCKVMYDALEWGATH